MGDQDYGNPGLVPGSSQSGPYNPPIAAIDLSQYQIASTSDYYIRHEAYPEYTLRPDNAAFSIVNPGNGFADFIIGHNDVSGPHTLSHTFSSQQSISLGSPGAIGAIATPFSLFPGTMVDATNVPMDAIGRRATFATEAVLGARSPVELKTSGGSAQILNGKFLLGMPQIELAYDATYCNGTSHSKKYKLDMMISSVNIIPMTGIPTTLTISPPVNQINFVHL